MIHQHPARWMGLWLALGLLLSLCAYPYLSQAVFSDDDGHILQLAIEAPYLGAYYMNEVYQQLSVVHYTPVALTIYRLMFELFGVTATPFLILQIGLLGLCAALAGAWCHRHTQQVSAGLMAILLIASLSSVWPMAARFYTLHYVLGGLFSLLLLLHLQKKPPLTAVQPTQALATSFVLALLSLLSKEIYAPLVLALWAWAAFQKHRPQAIGLLLAMLVYAGLRLHVLGFSTEGRAGNSLLADLQSLQADTLVHFAKWYVQTHALLMLATVLALVLRPLQTLKNILIACLRSVGVAARYVSGYLLTHPAEGQPRLIGADASHAWVSVYLPDVAQQDHASGGWLDLDPTNNQSGWASPGTDYVRLAIGRDFADVSPLRGVLLGGATHTLEVGVTVEPFDL